MEEKEIWRDIQGYEGKYQVSNMGRVKSLNYRQTGKERILRGIGTILGYLTVNLYQDGKMKTHKVHRLVALAFLPNPYNLPQINHLDENKENNCIDNLEWVSCKENINHGTRNQRVSEKERNDPKRSKPIIGIDKVTGLIVEFPSAMEASRQLDVDNSSICKCCKGKKKSCGGFYWYYVNDVDTE